MMKKRHIQAATRRYYLFNLILLSLIFFEGVGCKKFIEVAPPVTSVNGENVFTDDANAIAAVTGIFTKMSNTGFTLHLSLYPELSADIFKLTNLNNQSYNIYNKNALISDYGSGSELWSSTYNYVYLTNAAIIGLNNSTSITPAIKQRLLGELYFTRAFCYFYLINLYGNVPLSVSTDYTANAKLSRSDKSVVYQQIALDLLEAKKMLDDSYVDGSLLKTTTERVRPNKMAVNAMLARVFLYQKDYTSAENASTEVINETTLYSCDIPLDQVFLKNSQETIWAIQPVNNGFNTNEAATFIILPDQGPGTMFPLTFLDNFLASFEPGDQRKSEWIGSLNFAGKDYYYPQKYKIAYGSSSVTEYPIVLRLAEQYLIRAEARASQNKITESQNDLNVIRNRAGLSNTSANSIEALLSAILKERKVELFTEWGNRWLDLKRTGKIDEIMKTAAPLKGGNWESYKALYPIPFTEIQLNGNLTQNTGY